MDGKVWSKETTQLIVDYLFSKFKAKIPWFLKGIAKKILKTIIQLLNQYGDKVIPDRVDPLINTAIQSINSGNWDAAGQAIGVAADEIVTIKRIKGQHQTNAFIGVAMALTDLLKNTIEAKKK